MYDDVSVKQQQPEIQGYCFDRNDQLAFCTFKILQRQRNDGSDLANFLDFCCCFLLNFEWVRFFQNKIKNNTDLKEGRDADHLDPPPRSTTD